MYKKVHRDTHLEEKERKRKRKMLIKFDVNIRHSKRDFSTSPRALSGGSLNIQIGNLWSYWWCLTEQLVLWRKTKTWQNPGEDSWTFSTLLSNFTHSRTRCDGSNILWSVDSEKTSKGNWKIFGSRPPLLSARRAHTEQQFSTFHRLVANARQFRRRRRYFLTN